MATKNGIERRSARSRALALGSGICLAGSLAMTAASADGGSGDQSATTLEETRLTMGKWIETQQIISKERNEWQQGKEILVSRLELAKKEVHALEEKLQQAQSSVVEAEKKRDELLAQDSALESDVVRSTEAIAAMEVEVSRLIKTLPDPLQKKLELLIQRIPQDPANTRASAAERFQNVLGILNEVNKANSEITVSYEVRNLANDRPSEVQSIYVGLGQAYYVSASGEAGIGWPTAEGWSWKPSAAVAGDVLTALEILQGKHTPAFIPLPVTIQ